MSDCRVEELLVANIAEQLEGLGHVAVGAASPVPGAAALLARHLSGNRLRISILGSRDHNGFTDGGRELFDCAAQGRIDAFFLGGAQIDAQANINLVGIGEYPGRSARFPGSFGSSYLYFLIPNVFLFTLDHSPRVLVNNVDFISAPGTSEEHIYRPGGPKLLFSNLCVMRFEPRARRFVLSSVHPGHTLREVLDNTGFAVNVPQDLRQTAQPDSRTLDLIRGPVAAEIAEVYPDFAARVLGHDLTRPAGP